MPLGMALGMAQGARTPLMKTDGETIVVLQSDALQMIVTMETHTGLIEGHTATGEGTTRTIIEVTIETTVEVKDHVMTPDGEKDGVDEH